MKKVSITSLVVLSAVLAACSDTNPTATAPDAGPAYNETTAESGGSYTLDGAYEDAFSTQDAFAGMAGVQSLGAQLAVSANAASGSRASGHVGFPAGSFPPASVIVNEKYSFTALQTDPVTLAAKGQFEAHFTQLGPTSPVDIQMHGDVTCMITFGNTARVTAQITKVWRNGVQIPVTANTHAYWVVVDNGEGAATPDQVSLLRFNNATIAQNFCVNGFGSFVFTNQEGNVQVSQ
jgi:hypothetical protein